METVWSNVPPAKSLGGVLVKASVANKKKTVTGKRHKKLKALGRNRFISFNTKISRFMFAK